MTDAGTRTFEGLTIPTPGTFVLDPYHTRIGFSVRHMMVSRVRGRFSEFSGTITVAPDPMLSSATALIKAGSVDTGVPFRDADLKSEHFLNSEKFEDISFSTTKIAGVDGAAMTILGELTIKDQTHPIELTLEFEGVATTPAAMGGKQMFGFSLTGEIDREQWGMTYNMALETGGVVVGKKVKIEIEGEAVRQDG
jgi:polyisoprenoid-binding protein YceI